MKATLLKILFMTVLMIAIIPAVHAFESTLTLEGGVTLPYTDIDAEKTLQPMFGLSYEAWLLKYLSLGLSPYYTKLEAEDGLNNFESTIIGADLFLKLRATKFLALNFSDEAVINRISPFVAAGIGLANYSSTGNIDDGDAETDDSFDTKETVMVAPYLSAGLSFLTKWNFNIDLGVKAHYAATDLIDNLEDQDKNDSYITPYLGIGFNFGKKPKPVIVTSGTMTEFNAVKGTPSAAQRFTLSGTDLKKNVKVTAPDGYELSVDGGRNYVKSADLDRSFNGPIMVRLTGSNAGTYKGNVTMSSEDAEDVNIYVTGKVAEPPVVTPILVTGGTLGSFNTTKGTPSAAQRYTLYGTNLTGDIEINAPSGYEISSDGGANYARTAKLDSKFNGSILVRLNGDNTGTHTGNIVNTSADAKTINLPVSGTVRELEAGELVLRVVHFDTNLYDLSPSDKLLLDEVAASLKKNPDVKIQVQGHTDNTGNDAINEPLGVNRANVVKAYLVGKGIAASRLEVKGFSDTKPVDTNDTVEGRTNNRRTDLIVIK